MRHPIRALAVGALAIALAASGCSKTTKSSSGEDVSDIKPSKVTLDTEGKATAPAKEVDGAKKGGSLRVLQDGDFEVIGNPQGIYVSNALTTAGQLIHRSLTNYVEGTKPGEDTMLVGDLATNTGETNDNGKTWTYKLRDGIAFEDGSPITSADIAYGVARAFSPEGDQGPQYIQNWLQPDRSYKGPYNGGAALPPGVTTPDEKTIVFTFPEPHPDFPLAAAMPTTTPVPKAKDTKAAYNTAWLSSGPYKLKAGTYKKDQGMTLVRNDKWKPESDPIRHQYADEWVFSFDVSDTNQTQRLLADSGDDQTGIMISNVPVELVAQVRNNQDVQDRVVDGFTPFARYIYINTDKVKDLDVRKALNYAFDRDAYLKALGGNVAGAPASTIMSPTVPGYKKFDAFKAPANGDPEKAKSLLQGKTVEPLTYCFGNTPSGQKVAAGVKVGLERAGFTVNLQPTDRSAYYKTVGRKGTSCSLIVGGWGADYPDCITVLDPLFNGTKIVAEGNQNLSYYNNPEINDKLKKIGSELDREKAGELCAELDQELMEKHAPVIPTVYDKQFSLIGSKVGGAYLTPLFGQTSFNNLYVKQ